MSECQSIVLWRRNIGSLIMFLFSFADVILRTTLWCKWHFHSLKPSGVFSFRYMPRLCAAVGKAMFHLQLAPTHQKKLEPLMTIKSWIWCEFVSALQYLHCTYLGDSGVCRSGWQREERWSILSTELPASNLTAPKSMKSALTLCLDLSRTHCITLHHIDTCRLRYYHIARSAELSTVLVALGSPSGHPRSPRKFAPGGRPGRSPRSESIQDTQGGEKLEHHKNATEAGSLGSWLLVVGSECLKPSSVNQLFGDWSNLCGHLWTLWDSEICGCLQAWLEAETLCFHLLLLLHLAWELDQSAASWIRWRGQLLQNSHCLKRL